jgi:hypothetical protein
MVTVMELSNFKHKLNQYKGELFCFFLWILVCLNEYIWLNINKYPQYWDAAGHFIDSIHMFHILNGGLFAYLDIIRDSTYYPPLVAFSGTPFYFLFGPSINVGTLGMNCTYLGILIFSVYGLGKNIKNVYTGILAAIIVISFPVIGELSKIFMIDIPLVALVSLSLYLLLKTELFSNKNFSIFFGISLGLGMLTKWTFVFFLLGPIIYFCVLIYRNNRTNTKNLHYICKNFLLSTIIGGLIASIWYLPHLKIIFELSSNAGINTFEPNYFIITVWMASLYFTFLFLIMTGYLLYAKKTDHKICLLLLSVIIPFIILSLQSNRDARFIAPILPAMALIISIGIFSLKNSSVRRGIIIISILFTLVLFTSTSYGTASIPYHNELGLDRSINIGQNQIPIFGTVKSLTRSPNSDNWKEKEIYDTLLQDAGRKQVSICVIPESGVIIGPLWYNAYIDNWSFSLYEGGYDPYSFFNCEYVLTLKDRNGSWGPEDSRHIYKKAMFAQDLFERYSENFVLMNTISLPDNSDLLIYKKQINGDNVSDISHPFNVTFSDKIRFLGYDLTEVGTNKTEELELIGRITNTYKITYYWKCIGSMDKNYKIFVHFTDNRGNIIFGQDHDPVYGMYPISQWIPGNIYEESYFVSSPPNTPAGNYSMGIGLYTLSGEKLVPDNEQKDRYDMDRVPIGNFLVIYNQTEVYKNMPDYLKN